MLIVCVVGERYNNVFPCKKEHVDNIRLAVQDVNPSGFVVMWVCLCYNEDNVCSWLLAAEQVVERPCVGGKKYVAKKF